MSSPALRAAFGLAVYGHALFFLALLGQLRPVPIAVLTIAGGALLVRSLPKPKVSVLFAPFALILPLALHPPLAFDETLYHLPFVRALAETGELRFLPDLRFPAFPQLHELLCVPLFLLAGDAATHLVSLVEVALTAALLLDWGRRYGANAGPLAAALFLGSPIVVHLATIGYVDAALALFVTAGFYCLDRADARAVALAGFFFGTACSAKYLGGFFAVCALLFVAARTRRVKDTAIFAACCAAAALPTTLWLIATSGNPLFPFATRLFGPSPWALTFPPESLQTHLVRPLRVLWDVTFARERVNLQPPFTPFLIPAVALVFGAAWRSARGRFALAAGVVYLLVFAFLPQDSRYLVPLLPLTGLAAAVALAKRWPNAPAWLALIAIAPGVAYGVHRHVRDGLPPVTPAAREAALAKRIPEYRALRRANGTVYVCGAEQLQYHARGRLLGDFNGPYSYERILGDPANLRRIPASHYLVSRRVCAPPADTRGLELVYEDAAAQLWAVRPQSSSPHSR